MTNELIAEPVLVDEEISKFSCYAKTGIGYLFSILRSRFEGVDTH